MIKVTLRSGEQVEVKGGKAAIYKRHVEKRYIDTEEELGVTLEIKDGDSYNSGTLASFVADDVLYFTDEGEDQS